MIEKEFRDKGLASDRVAILGGLASDRVAILGGLESIMMQKKFHVDPHRTGIFVSYGHEGINRKTQDSINASLRVLLEKVNRAGLLTDRVYTYTLKGIDSGQYIADMQLIGHLTEMSYRLESLAPDRLLPVAEELHKNGIVSDSSFVRLKNDIRNEKIESSSQLNDYCRLSRTFDLTKYADDPDVWLKQLHQDMASILPGLNFTDFSYTPIPDTSFSIPGVRFKVSLICNGRTYKHTSLAISNFKNKSGKITPKDIFVEDFYRIFNKILTDQQSPYRLCGVMLSPGKTADDHFRYFTLIALQQDQAKVFMRKPCMSYMDISMESYDSTLTSGRIDSTIAGWKKIGLFAHLSEAEIDKAIDDAQASDLFSIDRLLTNFPKVTYSFESAFRGNNNSYTNLLRHIAEITHGAFNPTRITQRKSKNGIELKYSYKGRIHLYTFKTRNGWLDDKFPDFVKSLGQVNELTGGFYWLPYDDAIIYLTQQQYADAVTFKLLDFRMATRKKH